eukprot:363869-Chlamydomonas_euryale.AAC.1
MQLKGLGSSVPCCAYTCSSSDVHTAWFSSLWSTCADRPAYHLQVWRDGTAREREFVVENCQLLLWQKHVSTATARCCNTLTAMVRNTKMPQLYSAFVETCRAAHLRPSLLKPLIRTREG